MSLSSYYCGEEIFLLSHFYSWDFYLFHQIELVRLAALSAEMKILGGLSGSCFVYSNSAVFDLNIFPGVWTRWPNSCLILFHFFLCISDCCLSEGPFEIRFMFFLPALVPLSVICFIWGGVCNSQQRTHGFVFLTELWSSNGVGALFLFFSFILLCLDILNTPKATSK